MKLVKKGSGEIVDVPDDQAQAAFMSGQYGVMKGAPMPVKAAGLPAGVVDPADAAEALKMGTRVATEQEYRAAQQESRYGGPGSAIAAGVVGAARGAAGAFGVPFDQAALDIAELGGANHFGQTTSEVDPYAGARTISPTEALRERLRGYNEQHPLASGLGELVGMVGAGAATGGAGVLGSVGAAGEAAAGTVGRFAAEGGFLGGLGAVNEAALGDPNITAAKVLAAVGHGAIVGGALGGVAHLGHEAVAGMRDRFGRWVSSIRPKDIEAVAEKHFGYAPEGLGERVQKGYAEASSALSGKDEGTISRFTKGFMDPDSEGYEARRIAVFDAPKVQEEAERAVRKHIDHIMSAGDLVSAEARGSLKADYVRKAIQTGNEAEVRAYATGRLDALINGVDEQLGQEMAPSMIKSVESVSKLAYAAREAIASGDNAAAFVALDNVKRGVQRLTSTGYKSLRLIADPVDQLNAKRTVAWLDGAAQDLRAGLENEGLWGKAATDQRAINAAWTQQIDASSRFHRALTTEVGRDPTNPYLQMRGADPAKVASYVKGLTNPHNDLTHQAVRDYVESTRNLSEAISKSYDLPTEKLAEVERVRGSAAAFGKEIEKAETSLVTANQYRALLEAPEAGSVAGALGTIGGLVGGLPGGILGTVAGAVLNAGKNPGKVVAQMAAIERLATQTDNEIVKGASSFLSGAKSPKRSPPASVEMLAGKGGEISIGTSRKTFEAKVGEIQRLANSPEELAARIREFTDQFGDVAPNVATALTAAAVKGVQYLSETAPPGFAKRPEALAWGINEPPLYTDAEMREWSRRAAVVNDWKVAVQSMKRKMLTPEEAEALHVVYTPVYEQLQREFQKQRTASPGRMPYGQSLQVELMFGVPLNRTLEPAFMRTVQQSFKVVEPRAIAPRPLPGLSSNLSRAAATHSQQIGGIR